jgi:hypothetical protein
MDPVASILGFLQIITILGIGFVGRKLWEMSISLARIETSLSVVCKRTHDHEDRLRALENHPDLAA